MTMGKHVHATHREDWIGCKVEFEEYAAKAIQSQESDYFHSSKGTSEKAHLAKEFAGRKSLRRSKHKGHPRRKSIHHLLREQEIFGQ